MDSWVRSHALAPYVLAAKDGHYSMLQWLACAKVDVCIAFDQCMKMALPLQASRAPWGVAASSGASYAKAAQRACLRRALFMVLIAVSPAAGRVQEDLG